MVAQTTSISSRYCSHETSAKKEDTKTVSPATGTVIPEPRAIGNTAQVSEIDSSPKNDPPPKILDAGNPTGIPGGAGNLAGNPIGTLGVIPATGTVIPATGTVIPKPRAIGNIAQADKYACFPAVISCVTLMLHVATYCADLGESFAVSASKHQQHLPPQTAAIQRKWHNHK
ncbi:hypothetical protein RND71_013458 [Anisodus tanguticus]|uniref:Uncharacterized protein n=1 Tax=Anisodus tanguticus TaxID=243964 RepID=A0AAE1SJ10_9SOLA|nr:hypothetical protein RND71_013458 [Anisodus tanguticus]